MIIPEGAAVQTPDVTGGFAALLGLRFDEATGDRVVIRWTCRPELLQPHGLLHGGVYCSVVETAASVGAGLWLGAGRVVGVANQTDFLCAVRAGELTAVGTPVHRGRSQQLWQVEIADDRGRLVARGQVRLQNLITPVAAGPPGAPPAADPPTPGAEGRDGHQR